MHTDNLKIVIEIYIILKFENCYINYLPQFIIYVKNDWTRYFYQYD